MAVPIKRQEEIEIGIENFIKTIPQVAWSSSMPSRTVNPNPIHFTFTKLFKERDYRDVYGSIPHC